MLMPIKKLLERNALFIAIFLTLFIAVVSLISFKGVHLVKVDNSDKFGHLLAYFLLSLSWLFALNSSSKKKIKTYILILILISYGIIIEVLQGVLTTYRQADVYDIMANTIGVLFAVILFKKVYRKS